jgi:hypothetical protein
MATVLHLLKAADAPLAPTVIEQQVGVGDRVTVVLLPAAARPTLPAGVTVHRIPDDLSYDGLLDLIFASEQVIAW